MKRSTKLKKKERSTIARLLGQRKSIREIGRILERSHTTISEEIERHKTWDGEKYIYDPIHAQESYERCKREAGKRAPLKNTWVYRYVMERLRNNWSPEQISGRLAKEHPLIYSYRIGTETIYRYIYSQENKGEALWEYLARGQKKRKKQRGRTVHRSHIPDRVSISTRPSRVNKRQEFGHYEGDTVEGRRTIGDGIHTEVERVSRKLFAEKVTKIASEETSKVQIEIFEELPEQARKSTTLDNGKENHMHYKLKTQLQMKTYFAHPYSSFERGTNENTNGLLRRYFPKKTDFQTVSQEELDEVVEELNNRPRKVLQYRTPNEVFNSFLTGCSDST